MKKTIACLSTSGALFAISALPALAGHGVRHGWGRWHGGDRVRSVPEIDASAGLLAIAAVLVVMALVWERNRRHTA